jgi:hypothetical protein
LVPRIAVVFRPVATATRGRRPGTRCTTPAAVQCSVILPCRAEGGASREVGKGIRWWAISCHGRRSGKNEQRLAAWTRAARPFFACSFSPFFRLVHPFFSDPLFLVPCGFSLTSHIRMYSNNLQFSLEMAGIDKESLHLNLNNRRSTCRCT